MLCLVASLPVVPDGPVLSLPVVPDGPVSSSLSSIAAALQNHDDFDQRLNQTINDLKTESDQVMQDSEATTSGKKRAVSERDAAHGDDEEETKRGLDTYEDDDL